MAVYKHIIHIVNTSVEISGTIKVCALANKGFLPLALAIAVHPGSPFLISRENKNPWRNSA
jgi:adenine/guanine phosphoribosyltransferase-like PRPP-binding protein